MDKRLASDLLGIMQRCAEEAQRSAGMDSYTAHHLARTTLCDFRSVLASHGADLPVELFAKRPFGEIAAHLKVMRARLI